MKRKINIQFAIITMVAIIFTVILSMTVYSELFQKEVRENLRICAYELKNTGIFDDSQTDYTMEAVDNVRITLIDTDGTVAFDTNASIGELDNHGQRPEIQEALQNGEGETMRRSATMNKTAFYFALRLDNGQVLRVAKEAGNVWSMLSALALPLGMMSAALILVSVILTHFLTTSILAPIEHMASHMDDEDMEITYRELEPFMETIRKQHKDIVKSSQMRQEFTANVSHELKTPLTAISGYAELIANGMTSGDDTIRFAGEISKSSNRLLTLINDILRLSELDASTEVPMEEIDLYELAEKCVSMLQISAEKQNVTLMLTGKPTRMQANREMMEELLYNLVSNAIRYNRPYGNVVVSVSREDDHVDLAVEDTGIGISQADQGRIFERFYRVDKSRSKSTGGTGLGLAIVKHAVQCHGAKLDLKSQLGSGTRIEIKF